MKPLKYLVFVCALCLLVGCGPKERKYSAEVNEDVALVDIGTVEEKDEELDNSNKEEISLEKVISTSDELIKKLQGVNADYVGFYYWSNGEPWIISMYNEEDEQIGYVDYDNETGEYKEEIYQDGSNKEEALYDEQGRVIFKYDGTNIYTYKYNEEKVVEEHEYRCVLDMGEGDAEFIAESAVEEVDGKIQNFGDYTNDDIREEIYDSSKTAALSYFDCLDASDVTHIGDRVSYYKYEDDRLIQVDEKYNNSSETFKTTTYVYNDEGKRAKQIVKYSSDDYENITDYEYDNLGFKELEIERGYNQEINSVTVYRKCK